MAELEQQRDEQMVRVVVYVAPRKHRALRAKLALRGISVSEWVRRLIDKVIRE